jgi:hypothetical protein
MKRSHHRAIVDRSGPLDDVLTYWTMDNGPRSFITIAPAGE